MPCSSHERSRRSAAWAPVVLLGLLWLGGCSHSTEGTIQVSPESRNRGTDAATKVRRDADSYQLKDPAAPTEPGQRGRGRGRASL
jgi:hypothetical protein